MIFKLQEIRHFIGFHIKRKEYLKLRLLTICENTNVSKVMQSIFSSFLENKPSTKELIEYLVEDFYKEWNKRCLENKNRKKWRTGKGLSNQFNLYLNEIRLKLRKKKISESAIDIIIKKIEEMEIENNQ